MKIYTYWVTPENRQAPVYIRMCVKTWEKLIPSADIIVINDKNVADYIGNDIDIASFRMLSLPQQSDVVSVAVLSKLGGLFIDADTIVTGDITSIIETSRTGVFHAFGFPERKAIHLAVMWCRDSNNSVLKAWYKTICEKMKVLPAVRDWDYVGNSIIGALLHKDEYTSAYKIIDRTNSGNIMESVYDNSKDTRGAYLNFWFRHDGTMPEEIITKAQYRIISLHNSWTPWSFKNSSVEEIVASNIALAKLLCYLLQ
ncbi:MULTISPECIES: capsular polysaccharide synthesis protein [Pseudescherichia]|uniref:capsular polysaccharide synthesis protein n=1 Tax=Pseudescherichia TaxID=2055880 RepID=UPI001EE0D895|nr:MULTISPECIES: capsular polysaccharide synthesis protein [Pseudescherichia]